jgi:hypothetical protein
MNNSGKRASDRGIPADTVHLSGQWWKMTIRTLQSHDPGPEVLYLLHRDILKLILTLSRLSMLSILVNF